MSKQDKIQYKDPKQKNCLFKVSVSTQKCQVGGVPEAHIAPLFSRA